MKKEKTIFEKIINGEIPTAKVYEDDVCIVIMDKFPLSEGQCLVIPKKAVDYAFDLDTETYSHIFEIAKKIVPVLDEILKPIRTCLIVEGFEVPHAHIKLVPAYQNHLPHDVIGPADDKTLEELAKKLQMKLNLN